MRVDEPDNDHGQDAQDEQPGRQQQELGRLSDPEHVDRREENQAGPGDHEQMALEGREDAGQAGRPGSQADGNGEHVIDHQGGGRQERRPAAQVGLGHRVGPAAVGVSGDHLGVGDDQDDQHPGDHAGEGERPVQRAGSGQDEHHHHGLRPVGHARERVQAERRHSSRDPELVTAVGMLAGSLARSAPRIPLTRRLSEA